MSPDPDRPEAAQTAPAPQAWDGAGSPDAPDAVEMAARAALGRARAAARAKGLRPGMSPASGFSVTRARRRIAGEARSSAGPDARDPQPFQAALEQIVGERGWGTDVAVGGVMGRWAQVVGTQLADHVHPETFEDGTLTVRADSTAWATQVGLLVPTLLRRLGEELGEGVVLRVSVAGPGGPSWRRGPRTVRGRGPRDTYG